MPYRLRRGMGAAYSSQVQSIAQAIAFAEGYPQAGASSAPVRNNNPCDIGGAGQSYATIDDGWDVCYAQVQSMLSGTSQYYTPDESISDIAPTYTGNDNSSSWAAAVSQALGVSPSTPLSAIGSSSAGIETDASTGLETANTGDSSLSDLLAASGSGSGTGIQLLDDSGNLTGWGWGAIALVGGLFIWAMAR
jgi:hypothetical protein